MAKKRKVRIQSMTQFIDPAIVPKKKLYTGEQMPCIGMGTFGSDRVGAE